MSIFRYEQKHIRWLWSINALIFVVMLIASLTVDGNGRIFGLNEASSLGATIVIITFGLLTSGLLIVLDKHRLRRALAVGIILVNVLMLLPAVMP